MPLAPFSFGVTASTTAPETLNSSPVSESPRPKRRGRPPSIGIRLGEDGKADISGMAPDRVEKLRAAIAGTQLLTEDDKKRLEAEKAVKIRSFEGLVAPLYKLLGGIESAIIQASRKCPPEQADIFKYTQAEIDVLKTPTAAVLVKHGGRLENVKEELELGLHLVSIFHAKTVLFDTATKQALEQKREEHEKRSQVEAVASIESEQIPQQKINGTLETRIK